ncbi:hypothetical protein [Streptomyces sp. NPDC052107]
MEALFAERDLTDPWGLCPETTDVALAKEWFTAWTEAPGIGG